MIADNRRAFWCILLGLQIAACSIFYGAVHTWAWSGALFLSWAIWMGLGPNGFRCPATLAIFIVFLCVHPTLAAHGSFSPPYNPKIGEALFSLAIPTELSALLDSYEARMDFYRWLLPLSTMLITSFLLHSPRDFYCILRFLIAVAVFQGILGAVQYFLPQDSLSWLRAVDQETNVTGTYVNRNTYACFLAIVMIAVVSTVTKLARHSPLHFFRNNRICLLVSCLLPMLLGILAGLSRGGLLCMCGGAAVFIVAYAYVHKRPAALWSLPFLFAAVGTMVWLLGPLHSRFAEIHKEVYRYRLWATTIDIIRDHPLFGVGGGCYKHALKMYHNQEFTDHLIYAHNDYLQFAAEYGLFGMLLLGSAICVWLRRALRNMHSGRSALSPTLWAGAAAAACVPFIHAFVDFSLHIPGHRLLCAFFLGALGAEKSDGRRRQRSSWIVWLLGAAIIGGALKNLACIDYAGLHCRTHIFSDYRLLPGSEAKKKFVQETLEGYLLGLPWDEDNPENHYKIAYLRLQLAELQPERREALEQAARNSLVSCVSRLPCHHAAQLRLARLLRDGGSEEKRALAMAHLASPYLEPNAMPIAKEWLRLWVKEPRQEYLELAADRFLLLNGRGFSGTSKKILDIWARIVPHWQNKNTNWWQAILPPESVGEAAAYFLECKKFSRAQELLQVLQRSDPARSDMLFGHMWLQRRDFDKACRFYRRCMEAGGDEKESLASSIAVAAAKKGRLCDILTLLAQFSRDSSEIRLLACENAIGKNPDEEVLRALQESAAKIAESPQMNFLFSRVYLRLGRPAEAYEHAEKAAAEGDIRRLRHFCTVLFAMRMDREIPLQVARYCKDSPRSASFYSWLAFEYARRENATEARIWAHKAILYAPDDVRTAELLRELEK